MTGSLNLSLEAYSVRSRQVSFSRPDRGRVSFRRARDLCSRRVRGQASRRVRELAQDHPQADLRHLSLNRRLLSRRQEYWQWILVL
jgi:hypothetical protein